MAATEHKAMNCFNAEAQRTQRSAKKNGFFFSANLRVLCVSAFSCVFFALQHAGIFKKRGYFDGARVVPTRSRCACEGSFDKSNLHLLPVVLRLGTSRAPFRLRLRRVVSLRSLVALGALVLASVISQAEDFTTLDGKIFTNITDIAKYPNQVVFTFNEKRTPVAISNLSAEFRTKHGVKEQERKSTPRTDNPQTSSVDQILARYHGSDLAVEKEMREDASTNDVAHSWNIRLTTDGFTLTAYEFFLKVSAPPGGKTLSQYSDFQLGEEAIARQTFDKFIEWADVASKNNAEPFKKVISHYRDPNQPPLVLEGITLDEGGMRSFAFQWDKGLGFGEDTRAMLIDSGKGVSIFHKSDVLAFRQLMKSIPEMKEALLQKIQNKEAQKDLFK